MDDDAQPARRALPPVPPVGKPAEDAVPVRPAPPITRRGRHSAAAAPDGTAPEVAVPLAPVRRRMTDLERTTGSHRPVRDDAADTSEKATTGAHRAVTDTGSHRALPPRQRSARRRWVPVGVAGAVGSVVLTVLLVTGAFAADEATEPAAEVGPVSTSASPSATTTSAARAETTAATLPTSAAPAAVETTAPPAPTTRSSTAQPQRTTSAPAPRSTTPRSTSSSSPSADTPVAPPPASSPAVSSSSAAPESTTSAPTTSTSAPVEPTDTTEPESPAP